MALSSCVCMFVSKSVGHVLTTREPRQNSRNPCSRRSFSTSLEWRVSCLVEVYNNEDVCWLICTVENFCRLSQALCQCH